MKRPFFFIITLCMIVFLILALSEGMLRFAGIQPWQYQTLDVNEPVVHEFDPVTGWKTAAGRHEIPAYHSLGKDFYITIDKYGRRSTGSDDDYSGSEIVIVGGSYSFGWGISDHETYAWKLQEKFPFLKVLNYGTDAFGTYQSLLILEQELHGLKSPQFVLYGFIEHHEDRNVAPSYWLKILAQYSRRSHIYVPYVTVNREGMLVRHIPETHARFPLRESFSFIAFSENLYMKLKSKHRASQKREVTEKLMIEMNKLTDSYGVTFVVVILRAKPATINHYVHFLQSHNIAHVNCAYPITHETRVPGDIHPNGKMHSRYAECIAESLRAMIKP